jgi:Protein of unknown function (DUF4058)
MPIHDWTRVRSGTFHHFHQRWISALADALNTGGLPPGYFALAEQRVPGPEPDVVTLQLPPTARPSNGGPVGLAVEVAPPRARFVIESDTENYARREEGDVVAVIEIVSPGNKDSQHAIQSFVRKAAEFLDAGIHLLIVDLFPPTPRDPQGIHKAIWDEYKGERPFALPPDKPLTLVAYAAGGPTAYVEPVGVGDVLPDMSLFLTPNRYVPCPLEATYQTAWSVFPAPLKGQLEPPAGEPGAA